MKFFICVGHSKLKNGLISSADGTKNGGTNEYLYNKKLAPLVVEWLKKAGHEAVLCIAPEGQCTCLNDEISYFIGEEKKDKYDVSVQLHLNAYNSTAYGCEAYAYSEKGLQIANKICERLGTSWKNRGAKIRRDLYWTKRTSNTAVLIESFFCDNKKDYEEAVNIGASAHAKLIAEGLVGKAIPNADKESKITSESVMYTVQMGAYKNKENAEKMKEKLKAAGFEAVIKKC